MPERLTIKRPKPINKVAAWIVGVPLAFVTMWCFRLFEKEENIHFENPWLNLAVHSALILVPILISLAISLQRTEFAPTEETETLISQSSYLNTFRASWWTLLLVWPPGVFATFVLLHDLLTEYWVDPESLSTSPLRGLLIMAVAFGVSLLYMTMLLHRFAVRVSVAGIRTGLIRFLEWESIDHVRAHGQIYALYLRPQPELPIAFVPFRDKESKALIERLLSEHNIPLSNPAGKVLMVTKLIVLGGFIVNLLLCFWLWWFRNMSPLAVIGISLAIGMFASLMLDHFRGLGKLPKLSPVIDRATDQQKASTEQ
jgi:hypothetical protein